jgi:hypothetical protein
MAALGPSSEQSTVGINKSTTIMIREEEYQWGCGRFAAGNAKGIKHDAELNNHQITSAYNDRESKSSRRLTWGFATGAATGAGVKVCWG